MNGRHTETREHETDGNGENQPDQGQAANVMLGSSQSLRYRRLGVPAPDTWDRSLGLCYVPRTFGRLCQIVCPNADEVAAGGLYRRARSASKMTATESG